METKTYKLIDGIFLAEEAEKILNTVFNYKIDYHKREDFSNHIRFSKSMEHSQMRIQTLIQTKEAINHLIASAKANDFNLVIDGVITISLERKDV